MEFSCDSSVMNLVFYFLGIWYALPRPCFQNFWQQRCIPQILQTLNEPVRWRRMAESNSVRHGITADSTFCCDLVWTAIAVTASSCECDVFTISMDKSVMFRYPLHLDAQTSVVSKKYFIQEDVMAKDEEGANLAFRPSWRLKYICSYCLVHVARL